MCFANHAVAKWRGSTSTARRPPAQQKLAQIESEKLAWSTAALLGVTAPPVGVSPEDKNLRLFPLYIEHAADDPAEMASWPPEKWDATRTLVERMVNQKLLAGADFGAPKYGAILYQVARKFFEGSRAQPDLGELIKAGNDVDGWHTGYVQGHGDLSAMHMEIPHTYLGGMPNVCSGGNGADPCATGQPT